MLEDVALARDSRLICMCDDCQAYAHWLRRADEILDEHGGTEVFQVTPRQVKFTDGKDQIRCMRLSPKGLLRWYAACCKTPLANSLASPRVPFLSLTHMFLDPQSDGKTRDEALGPILAAGNGRFAVGPMPEGGHARFPLGIVVRAARHLLGGWLRGMAKPSPIFDATTGAPIVEPTVISLEDRKRLLEKCGPHPTATSASGAT